ncbi:hypothetical protein [Actinomadura nitritigenes]|uniref:hypothetical protein n=1 Tax=Actinomadura nitritigenes TaxID=134602 RepID=UPI003D91F0EA
MLSARGLAARAAEVSGAPEPRLSTMPKAMVRLVDLLPRPATPWPPQRAVGVQAVKRVAAQVR